MMAPEYWGIMYEYALIAGSIVFTVPILLCGQYCMHGRAIATLIYKLIAHVLPLASSTIYKL